MRRYPALLFNSYFFILFFLPISLLIYFGLNHIGKYTLAKLSLIGSSLWFYGYYHLSYLLIISGSIIVNFLCSRALIRVKRKDCRKVLLICGLLFNLGIIFYYKYFDFFLDNLNGLLKTSLSVGAILMPLGISFFTFQQISYLVDSYRMETKNHTFVDYALFITFFPQLVAGPIVLHQEMLPQFADPKRKKLDQEMLARGIWFFSIGLFKKVMIADILGKGVDWGYANASAMTGPEIVIVSLLYTFQIYFDFSGYCDMACGIANMFHIDLPVNFMSPYKASSILEFWKRWHITLTRFLRKYIYFPLGGNKRGTARTLINVMIVFLISGIWHGAAWTFIFWGCLHGIAYVLCRSFRDIWEKVPKWIAAVSTFLFVNFSWILFRAESIEQAGIIFKKLFSKWEFHISAELLNCFHLLEFTYLEDHIAKLGLLIEKCPGIHLIIILTAASILVFFKKNVYEKKFLPSISNALFSIFLLTWSIISLSGLSTFLYFNF